MHTLVLNLGLKSIRSIVFDHKGHQAASAYEPVTTRISGNRVEQDPGEWWDKGLAVIQKTLVNKNIRKNIGLITVTASSSCLVPVNEEGSALCHAIMVSDRRAVYESALIRELPVFSMVQAATGLSCDPYLMLPKILWLKNNEPAIFSRAFKFLSPNDFLVGQLTGRFITDNLNAQKYHYDPARNCYPEKLLEQLGIPIASLPDVVETGSMAGTIGRDVAVATGLSLQTEVMVTTYDAICAFIGSGPGEPGEACDVSGTVTSLRAFSENPVTDCKNRILNTPFPQLGLNIVGGSNNLGGGLIEWAKQCFYQGEKEPYALMEKEAAASIPGAGGLIFLPYLLGERAPLWDPDARGVFFGLERTHNRGDLVRAVFESSGHCLKGLVEIMEGHGVPVNRIRLSGGLARIDLVSQIKADITGKEVLVVAEHETTALGAAILAWLGCGHYKSLPEATSDLVVIAKTFLPDRGNYGLYAEMHRLFQKSYYSLKGLFSERSQAVKKIYTQRNYRLENL